MRRPVNVLLYRLSALAGVVQRCWEHPIVARRAGLADFRLPREFLLSVSLKTLQLSNEGTWLGKHTCYAVWSYRGLHVSRRAGRVHYKPIICRLHRHRHRIPSFFLLLSKFFQLKSLANSYSGTRLQFSTGLRLDWFSAQLLETFQPAKIPLRRKKLDTLCQCQGYLLPWILK